MPTCSTSQMSLGENDLHIVQYYILKNIPANIYVEHVHMEDAAERSIKFILQGGTQTHVAQ
jgi:hypothetical protein